MEIGFGEKLADMRNKLRTAANLVPGMLPGGQFQMHSRTIDGPHGPYSVKCFKNQADCVGPQIRQFLRANGAKDWIIYEKDKISFREAEQLIDQIGAELAASFGVRQGTAVSIAMRNTPEFMIAFLAIVSMGAIGVPLNSLWGTPELEYAAKDSGTQVIFGDIQRLRSCLPFLNGSNIKTILCRGTSAEAQEIGATMWDEMVASGKGKPFPSIQDIKPDDSVMIMYTSGSTGFPKGVVHSQLAMNTCLRLGVLSKFTIPDPAPACLLAVPLFHITALAGIFLISLARAEKIVLMYKWDAGEALDLIQNEKISRFTGVPTMVGDMLNHPSFSQEKVKTLKVMGSGGGPVPPGQLEKTRKKAKSIGSAQGYGLTETFGVGTAITGTDYLKNPGSCGKALPLIVDLCVKDASGKKLSEGMRGEVCIKTAMMMKGYNNKAKETADVFDNEGYFHTGDVGEMHGGFLYIKDRLKDIIIRGGENIDCSEVEGAFYTFPGSLVREVSVFGLPDERLGEVVGCCMYIEGPSPPLDDLRAHVLKCLAKFKVPEPNHIFIRNESLPKGATGKIDKKGMREFYKSKMAPTSKL